MPRPRRSARQFAEMVQNPQMALDDPRYWNRAVCRRWLDHVDDRVHYGAAKAIPLAIIGVRLAFRTDRLRQRRGLRDRCVLAQAYAVLGSTYRAAGKLDKAARALGKAVAIAGRCPDPDVRSDVMLRRAILLAYAAQRADGTLDPAGLEDATRLSEAAVSTARGPLAEARARNVRGIIRYHTGNLRGSAADGKRSLDLLDQTTRPYDHASALSVVVLALAKGEKADRREGAEYLEQLRIALPPRCPEFRARFLWAEALLYFDDRQRKGRTRKLLDQARRKFIGLGPEMAAEAAAVTAELARHAPEGAVPRLCGDLLPILTPGPIRDLVEQLRRARVVDRVSIAERLRRMVEGPGVLPAAA